MGQFMFHTRMHTVQTLKDPRNASTRVSYHTLS